MNGRTISFCFLVLKKWRGLWWCSIKKWPHVSNWFKIIFLSHHLSIRLLFVGRWISKASHTLIQASIFCPKNDFTISNFRPKNSFLTFESSVLGQKFKIFQVKKSQNYNFRIVWLVQINSIQQSQIADRTSFKKDLGRNFGSPGERNYSSFLCVENPVKTINFLAMDCMKDYLRSFIDHIFRGERIFHHNGWPKNCRFFHQLSNPKKSYFTRKWMDRGEKLGNLILTSFEVVFFSSQSSKINFKSPAQNREKKKLSFEFHNFSFYSELA